MPVPTLPVAAVSPGNVLTSTMWNSIVKDSVNKLLNQGHRVLTVAQFAALTGLEGTKGTVAPDEVYLEVDATNGIEWHLAYESGEATYKWRYLGGPALYSEIATLESTSSATFVALGTAGPSVALSRAGDYDVVTGALTSSASSSGQQPTMSYDIGGTGAVDADAVQGAAQSGGSLMRTRRKTAIAASTTLTAKYKSVTANGTGYANRFMAVTPARLL